MPTKPDPILWIGEHAVPCHFESEVKCENELVFGYFEPKENVIYIDHDNERQMQAKTLWHEALHAIVAHRIGRSVWSIPVDEIEEAYMRALETARDVLMDKRNAWFRNFVLRRFVLPRKKNKD